MLAKHVMEAVLAEALQHGGDFSELFVEDTRAHQVSMLNGVVENATYAHTHGAGVRVLYQTRSAYAYTNDTGEEALLATARAAAEALKAQEAGAVLPFAAHEYAQRAGHRFDVVENAARITLLREATKAAQAVSPEVSRVVAGYMDQEQEVLVCNSEGLLAHTSRPRTRLSVEVVAKSGAEAQTGRESPGLGMGFEAYERIDPAGAGREAASTALTMLHAEECPAAFLPVVIDGGFGGVIFHEACGHSLEATAVAKGNSVFCGMLGQRIAAECVSAVDDGTLAGEWGSIGGMDDEGAPARRNLLIENGVLKGYLIDRLGARRMGMEATGSSRRQGYSYAPTSRMTNTFILPGKDEEEEIIRSLAEGLFAKKMGGGSVNPLTGEFNFAVLEGYWVKNGQIIKPVRGATLVGKGADVLMHIDRVGKHMWMGQGMCGSQSGSIPTNVGQPRIRVDGMTIGGKGAR